ncbi:MAG: isoleucine--tRNA ligase [Desulfobacterota bacterium]|nr:isoleucine--tRNA ligase [Thermodesulfobacteriota bacterium]MDW8001778.1 isoleucine--tRNA ligase [Deltaproteobacteria bacterium]
MDYKDTLNLPKTEFPMKANLPQKEKEILEYWSKIDVYGTLLKKFENSESFVLHDGPPYANGHIHLGTALNKILKDIIVKSRFMFGYRADFVPGWDCHGLPIEHQIEKELKEKNLNPSKLEMRKLCRAYAEKYINIQREEFKRLGCFGDWERPYITMDYDYQASIIEEMMKFFLRGEVYRKKKPVYWCINCVTALAEAEIEYEMEKTISIYVKFPLKEEYRTKLCGLSHKPVFILCWTTTPWTLPANLALAINPEYEYVTVETQNEIYIAVRELMEDLMKKGGYVEYEISGTLRNDVLKDLKFRHPFYERDSIVVFAQYVAKDVGTGVVHIAPGHGEEDYETGLEYGLECYSPVDERGRFTEDVEEFKGLNVFEANRFIIEKLKERKMLFYSEETEHSYPHCWRCKKPVIFRATEQWFISLDKKDLRTRALREIDKVKWVPKWGRERIYNMLLARPDWCISRQRSWGIPITIFYCLKCGDPYWSEESFRKVIEEVKKRGADVWFEENASYFLPGDARCGNCGGSEFRKEEDIIDVWFDSGVSWAAVCKKRKELKFPADLYLEGSDQHRGWFHSSLLTSVANEDRAPYKTVLTHGFVVDGTGRKMSKSLGNIIAPYEIIDKYGAEILRLWVTYEDFRNDMRISNEIVLRLVETYRRIRNTLRFLHANLYDFRPDKDSIPYEQLSFVDKWILSRLYDVVLKCKEAYMEYNFHVIYHTVLNFCAVDLSALYLDIVKDRLYVERKDSPKRRGTQHTMYQILVSLVKLIAPILSTTAEEMWLHLKGFNAEDSVFLNGFPEVEKRFKNPEIEALWEKILHMKDATNKKIEEKRNEKLIGHSLDAKVTLSLKEDDYNALIPLKDELREILIVSQLKINKGEAFFVEVGKAEGRKCERCWHYSEDTGNYGNYVNVCGRCADILSSL